MFNIKRVNVSSFRKEIGGYLNLVSTKKLPVVIEKRIAGGYEDFLLINKIDFYNILDNLKFTVFIKEEHDQYILNLEELNIMVFEDTLESAIESLCYEVFDYAEDYYEEMDAYYNSKNRRSHFPYLLKIWELNNNYEKLKSTFRYEYK